MVRLELEPAMQTTRTLCRQGGLGVSLLFLLFPLLRPEPQPLELPPNRLLEPQNVTLAAILPLSNTNYPWAWPRVGPAVIRAVERVNDNPSLLPGHRLRIIFNSSENKDGLCSDSVAPLVAVDLKFSYDPWAFIGPGCHYSSSPVGRFTTHWDVPMVTAGAAAFGFHLFTSITNTGPTHKKLGEFGLHLHRHFGWRRHGMIMFSDHKDDDRPYYFTAEGLYELLRHENITTVDLVFNENSFDSDQLITDISQGARVVFSFCSWDTFRRLMVQFQVRGLPSKDYVFFFIDLFGHSLREQPARPWYRGDAHDHQAKAAFRSVKILTYKEPQNPEYQEFVANLKTDAMKMFNFTVEDSLMNLIAGGFYDGVMLYSQALNETMAAGGGRPRGNTVTRKMWNRTFHGVTGMFQIDEQGDREIDFALWDMTDVESGVFQVVSVYDSMLKELVPVPGMKVQWPGGTPPPDIPDCGFKNDKPACLARTVTMHQMVAIVVCFIFIIIITVTVFIYREVTIRSNMYQ